MKQKENICHILKKIIIANDEDKSNSLTVKSDVNMLEKTQLYMILNVQQKRIGDVFHILTI